MLLIVLSFSTLLLVNDSTYHRTMSDANTKQSASQASGEAPSQGSGLPPFVDRDVLAMLPEARALEYRKRLDSSSDPRKLLSQPEHHRQIRVDYQARLPVQLACCSAWNSAFQAPNPTGSVGSQRLFGPRDESCVQSNHSGLFER